MKKRKVTMFASVALTTALLFGCSQEGEIKQVTLSEQEQVEFINTFLDDANNSKVEPSKLVEDLNKNIAGLTPKQASDAVDALLYSIYQFQDNMNGTIQGLQPTLTELDETLDLNKQEDIDKIEDQVTKAFLQQAKDRLMKVQNDNGYYVVMADFETILNKYGSYINDDLKLMMEFSQKESETPYFSHETQKINYDVVAERILMMEEGIKEHPNSYYTEWMQKSKDFYYQHYFGLNGVSIANTDQKLLPEVEEKYKKILNEHKDSQLAKDITSFFEKYEESGQKVNGDVMVFLLELTNMEHQSVSEESAQQSEEGQQEGSSENSKAKEALRKAIEESESKSEKGQDTE